VRKTQSPGSRTQGRRESRITLPRLRIRLPLIAAALAAALLTSGFVVADADSPAGALSGAIGQVGDQLGESDTGELSSPAQWYAEWHPAPLLDPRRHGYPPWLLPRTATHEPRPDAHDSRLATTAPAHEPLIVNGRPQPLRVAVPKSASGRYTVVPGRASAKGGGQVVRYLVEVERGLKVDPAEFAAEVHRVLNHGHGWGRAGATRFVRVDSGPVRFRVSLSTPDLTDRQCHPLRTLGRVSCWNGSRAVINALRWAEGSPTYGRDVAAYREYIISHEVGHALGHGHVECPRRGRPAPVMVQQTKSLYGCTPNPWPYR
jgi:hypothetical protein